MAPPPRPKVIVVDDEVEVTYALQHYFQRKGYEMVTAFDGAQAMAQLERGPVDLVLLDVRMPEVNGVEALKHLRAERPVIVLTAFDDEYQRTIGRIGVHGFLHKPFGIEQLTQTIEQVLLAPVGQTVPLVHEAPAMTGQPSAVPKAKLLMIESSEYVFNLKRVFFTSPERCGGEYTVEAAYSMIEALERLHTFQPDLVLDLVAAGSLGDLAAQLLNSADRPKEL